MGIGKLLEKPDRATAAPYWDLTGLTGVKLGRPLKKKKVRKWGSSGNSGRELGPPVALRSDRCRRQRGSWVKAAFSPLHWPGKTMGWDLVDQFQTSFGSLVCWPRDLWLYVAVVCRARAVVELTRSRVKRLTSQTNTLPLKCWIPNFCLRAGERNETYAQLLLHFVPIFLEMCGLGKIVIHRGLITFDWFYFTET